MSTVVEEPGVPPEAAAAQHLMQLATGFIVSAALNVVAKLRVADLIGTGAQSAAALAKATGTHEDALYRVLRALAMVGVFRETEPRTFALNPAGTLLRSDVPGSLQKMIAFIADP